ncbi:MAG TPA: hypothetical protein VN794_07700, partial [Methylomirabilota bacterium]|nr:hypothetical protein [Methylomirabilota bacterium]
EIFGFSCIAILPPPFRTDRRNLDNPALEFLHRRARRLHRGIRLLQEFRQGYRYPALCGGRFCFGRPLRLCGPARVAFLVIPQETIPARHRIVNDSSIVDAFRAEPLKRLFCRPFRAKIFSPFHWLIPSRRIS